ncbi:hypothetical protein D3C85_1768580 [compost metagenome]
MEEAMKCLSQRMTHTSDSTNHIGSWAQVSHLTQVFDAVAFGCHWVSIWIIYPADDFHLGRLQFKALALTR